ncbi:MAG: Ig-like domain-containing protein, partial [Clostridia bacterium]|nr:Ig-like domain-containing protein [Clostridia bacterium]
VATITATSVNGKSATASITVVSKQSIPVSSLSVNPPTATLEVGDLAAQDKKTVQLTATVNPSDATNKSITWTTSDNAVAKVDANGLVTAVSPGVATIIATSVNGKSASSVITVVSKQSIPVSSVSVNPPTATVEVGDLAEQDKKTVQLTATVSPSDATNKSITWTTSDITIAKVDAKGLVTAVSAGTATITATASNGKSATASITVVSKQSIPVSSVSVNPPTATLEVGDLASQDKKTVQLTATVSPSDATNKSITWTSSDNTVAKVDANGVVTAVSAGTATITATASNGKSATASITVVSKQSIPVSSVSVNPPTATLEVGDLAAQDKKSIQLTATVSPSDATNKSITWTTSDNAVAKVDANGLVTAVSPGVATITATSVNGKSATASITVVSKQSIPVSSVSVNPPTATLEVGDLAAQDKKAIQLTATVSPSDATNKSITWTSSNNAVAKVDTNGLVTAVSAGTATITAAASNGKSATTSITVVSKQSVPVIVPPIVVPPTVPVSSVSVSPGTATLEVGDLAAQDKKAIQLTAAVSPGDATNKSITWTSSNDTVAKVDTNGLVTAVGAGTATITATSSNGKTASSAITVVSKQSVPVTSVSVNPGTATLEVGDLAAQDKKTVQLTATVLPNDATNKTITWTSSNNAIAKVDANGLVTATGAGAATITATSSNGKTANTVVTVIDRNTVEEPKIVYPLASIKFYDPYIVGYKDKTFRPQNNITRAEMAAIFARILKLDLNEAGQQQYSDVSSKNHWAYKYIQAISKVGIFSGYKDGTFKPDQPISRAEIAAVFVKYWDIIGANVDASKSSLKDVTGHWSETYIHKAFNAGLIQGFSDSTFKPDDKAKREQVVVLVNKMIGRPKLIKESSSFIDLPVIHWASGEIEAATVRFEE